MAAKNNTFWINAQRYNLKIKGYEMKDLPREVLLWNAQSVAASMDGAKDPVWGHLGIDSNNYPFYAYEVVMEYMRKAKPDMTQEQKKNLIESSRLSAWKTATHPEVKAMLANPFEDHKDKASDEAQDRLVQGLARKTATPAITRSC